MTRVFTFSNLAPDPNGISTQFQYGINDTGAVAGIYTNASSVTLGYIDNGGTYTTIDDPGSKYTRAIGINNSGTIAGYYEDSSNVIHGFVYNGSSFTEINDPNATGTTYVWGINASGTLVGTWTASGSSAQNGFIESNGTFTTVNDPNATGGGTFARGINNSGEITGYYENASSDYVGFIDNGGTFTTLSDPNADGFTYAEGIDAAGEVVGFYEDASSVYHGFLYSNGTYTTIDDPNATSGTRIFGISQDGEEITGYYGGSSSAETPFTATSPACYCPGTMIATPGGNRAIEELEIGDLVLTASGATCPIRWIGRRAYRRPFLSRSQQPVRIGAGALGNNLPLRDLLVSPRHAMWVDGRLIAAEALVNDTSIRVVHLDAVEYLHIELDTHELLLAEGAPSESYCDTGNRGLFENAHTALRRAPMTPMAPRVEHLPPACLTDDPALRARLPDGSEHNPTAVAPGLWRFDLTGAPEMLVLCSRSAVPAFIGYGSDIRRLGVALHRVVLRRDGYSRELDTRHFKGGFHPKGGDILWTDGEATLALSPEMLPGAGHWQLEIAGSALPAYPAAA